MIRTSVSSDGAAVFGFVLTALACGPVDLQADARKLVEDASAEAVDRLPDKAEVSESVTKWVAERASSDKVAEILKTGVQLAPAALEIARTLDEAIDADVTIEPVVQTAEDAEGRARLDRAIGDMARVETIEGVEVGFESMKLDSVDEHVRESAYLVLWRKDDHLLGFVYKSKREVDLETLIREAPRLVGLVNQAIGNAK